MSSSFTLSRSPSGGRNPPHPCPLPPAGEREPGECLPRTPRKRRARLVSIGTINRRLTTDIGVRRARVLAQVKCSSPGSSPPLDPPLLRPPQLYPQRGIGLPSNLPTAAWIDSVFVRRYEDPDENQHQRPLAGVEGTGVQGAWGAGVQSPLPGSLEKAYAQRTRSIGAASERSGTRAAAWTCKRTVTSAAALLGGGMRCPGDRGERAGNPLPPVPQRALASARP